MDCRWEGISCFFYFITRHRSGQVRLQCSIGWEMLRGFVILQSTSSDERKVLFGYALSSLLFTSSSSCCAAAAAVSVMLLNCVKLIVIACHHRSFLLSITLH